jgi:hypothetical protein
MKLSKKELKKVHAGDGQTKVPLLLVGLNNSDGRIVRAPLAALKKGFPTAFANITNNVGELSNIDVIGS